MAAPSVLYDADFYHKHDRDTRRSASEIVPQLVEIFEPRSVVDIGCGKGLWLAAFNACGITDVLGVDGPWVDAKDLEIPEASFQAHDLSQPLRLERQFDLALCLEVAEHLPAESASMFVESLCRLAKVVIFSAAIPFQGGDGHVNEQWQSYWCRIFAAKGFGQLVDLRDHFWAKACVATWYRQNMLCFVAEGTELKIDSLSITEESPVFDLVNIVHPDTYLRLAQELGRFKLYAANLEEKVLQTTEERNNATTELTRIKSTKAWRFYQAIRPAILAGRNVTKPLKKLS